MPASLNALSRCVPVYEEMPGWAEDISSARKLDQLPPQARDYLKMVEQILETPFSFISVGPMRDQTIELVDPFY